jgi:hypothetical protein
MHARMGEQIADTVRAHIHAIDVPIGRLEDPLGQVVADKTINAENENFLHFK